MELLREAIDFIKAIGPEGCFLLVLPLIFFELPRYTLLYVVSMIFGRTPKSAKGGPLPDYSVVIAGHNEAGNIRNVVISMREQSHPPAEILVVSDGSTDAMRKELTKLYDAGLIQAAHHVDLRGGKAASLNLIMSFVNTEFIAQVDCDSSFDRHAMRRALETMADQKIGVVSGNIVPRNDRQNLLTSLQAIEYLISISLGRQASDLLNQVSIASGAFTVYRRAALLDTVGLDAGSGEDLDITLKMRQRKWHVRFEPEAICFTDVPSNLSALTKQRLRWERDAISVRYRKYFDTINPFDRRFDPIEALHQIEFFFFNIIAAAITPFYFLYVYFWFEEATYVVMLASYLFLFLHDLLVMAFALYMNPRLNFIGLTPLLPFYSIYYIIYMRSLRLYAYVDEWLFRSSQKSDFVPQKVRTYLQEKS